MNLETLPPDFSEWIDDIDAAAMQLDIIGEMEDGKKTSIYSVTRFAKSRNPNAYTPKIISFGPFHHGAEHLKATELHKHKALAHFLHRARKPSDPFVSRLRTILQHLQDSYQGLDEKWKENPYDFLKMMLLDGCFLIEVLRLREYSMDYAPNDPVFSLQMMPIGMPYIEQDMLLLENQLPLQVIKALLEVENIGPTDSQYINSLVQRFCSENLQATLPDLAGHPLDLYRMSMLHGHHNDQVHIQYQQDGIVYVEAVTNALELWTSGVHFQRNEKSRSPRAIKFDPKTGTLELPIIHVHEKTEHCLLNIIAYEQRHVGVGCEITSYVTFMNALLRTEDDVKLLQSKGIIHNSLGSHQAVASLFTSLAEEAAPDPNDTISVVRYQLKRYYEKRVNKWRYSLQLQYFHNPWIILSVISASVVILFTFLQTLYSALSFHMCK